MSDPVRVRIKQIGVDADVIPLGLNPDRTLEVPTDYAQTGWYRGGPEPGEPGPAVIAGHVDSRSGPAVFYRLRELRPGDRVEVVTTDGGRQQFTVRRVEQHPKDAFPTDAVYGRTRRPTLRLVTCGGTFDRASGHYRDNIVVFADHTR
ncbi:MAG: class F sortase [Egibacteraceae bacterium]